MKKLIGLILAGTLTLSLAGCGGASDGAKPKEDPIPGLSQPHEAEKPTVEIPKGPSKKIDTVYGCGTTSFALADDGTLYCWGHNALVDDEGETTDTAVPQIVMEDVISFSSGGYTTMAVTSDGNLYCWGSNLYGSIPGVPTYQVEVVTPVKVMDGVRSVCCSWHSCAAITENNELYMWGDNANKQLGYGGSQSDTPTKVMDNVAQVAIGFATTAVVTTDGVLYTWGFNDKGQIGNGTTNSSAEPVKIMEGIASVSLSHRAKHMAAIGTDGSLYMWGENDCGEVGNGTQENVLLPVKVLDNVASVSIQEHVSTAITTDGQLYVWGSTPRGLEYEGSTDRPAKVMEDVKAISLGTWYTMLVLEDGLYTAGYNAFLQLGYETEGESPYTYTLQKVEFFQ